MASYLLWGAGALIMLFALGSGELGGEKPEKRGAFRILALLLMALAALMWRAA